MSEIRQKGNSATRDELITELTPVIKKILATCRKDYLLPDEHDDRLIDAGVLAFCDAYEDYCRSGSDLSFQDFSFRRVHSSLTKAAAEIGRRIRSESEIESIASIDFHMALTLVDVVEIHTKRGHVMRVVLLDSDRGARVVVEDVEAASTRDLLEMSRSFATEAEARRYFEEIIVNETDFLVAN